MDLNERMCLLLHLQLFSREPGFFANFAGNLGITYMYSIYTEKSFAFSSHCSIPASFWALNTVKSLLSSVRQIGNEMI